MIFEHMSLDEAKFLYDGIKKESFPIAGILLDDIWFFTNGLTQDYGGNKNEKKGEEK